MVGEDNEDDNTPLTVTMTFGEWTAFAEVLERALSVILERGESPRTRQNVKGLVGCLIDLHDDGVYVEAIDDPGSSLNENVVQAIEAADET